MPRRRLVVLLQRHHVHRPHRLQPLLQSAHRVLLRRQRRAPILRAVNARNGCILAQHRGQRAQIVQARRLHVLNVRHQLRRACRQARPLLADRLGLVAQRPQLRVQLRHACAQLGRRRGQASAFSQCGRPRLLQRHMLRRQLRRLLLAPHLLRSRRLHLLFNLGNARALCLEDAPCLLKVRRRVAPPLFQPRQRGRSLRRRLLQRLTLPAQSVQLRLQLNQLRLQRLALRLKRRRLLLAVCN